MTVQLHYAARSDVGLVRASNQDSAYAGPHLLVVADGMGGPAGGDIASSIAVAHLAPLDEEAHGADDLLDLLRAALEDAHAELMALSEADPELAGLGTTCIAILRSGNKLAMVHIGDSRAYLLRDGTLTQVTTDHTFVQHLVESGRLTPEQAEHHPQRNVILRALGDTEGDVELDESVREARVGDRWLLCSDGLFGVVSAETIAETLAGIEDPGACADELVTLALRGGGPDNVTCLVADVVDNEDVPTAPEVVGAAATDRSPRSPVGSSPAARAAQLVQRPPTGDGEDDGEPRRRRWLLAAVLLLAVAALAVAGWAGYRWTQTQYFVTVADGYVAIYRGIPQEVGPVSLAELHDSTDLAVEDLNGIARDRLRDPITTSSLAAAESTVDNLRTQVRPEPSPTESSSTSPAPTQSPSPEGGG